MILAQSIWLSRGPKSLLGVGFICTVFGASLIWKARHGDVLMPGTMMTYIPAWIFYLGGGLLQIPLPLAYFFLKHQGLI